MTQIRVGKKPCPSWLYHEIEMGGKMKSLEKIYKSIGNWRESLAFLPEIWQGVVRLSRRPKGKTSRTMNSFQAYNK
jgi:hypothetical protein